MMTLVSHLGVDEVYLDGRRAFCRKDSYAELHICALIERARMHSYARMRTHERAHPNPRMHAHTKDVITENGKYLGPNSEFNCQQVRPCRAQRRPAIPVFVLFRVFWH
jgi:hypothetical protein